MDLVETETTAVVMMEVTMHLMAETSAARPRVDTPMAEVVIPAAQLVIPAAHLAILAAGLAGHTVTVVEGTVAAHTAAGDTAVVHTVAEGMVGMIAVEEGGS